MPIWCFAWHERGKTRRISNFSWIVPGTPARRISTRTRLTNRKHAFCLHNWHKKVCTRNYRAAHFMEHIILIAYLPQPQLQPVSCALIFKYLKTCIFIRLYCRERTHTWLLKNSYNREIRDASVEWLPNLSSRPLSHAKRISTFTEMAGHRKQKQTDQIYSDAKRRSPHEWRTGKRQ